jgi:hypothetical protein
MLLSHTHGSTDLPLVDETIGAHLARMSAYRLRELAAAA